MVGPSDRVREILRNCLTQPVPTLQLIRNCASSARHTRPIAQRNGRFFAGERPQRGTSMLVLSRKKNESIIINDHIVVTVVEIRGDKVRLGIDAPKDVSVHRREVYEAIQSQ